MNLSDFFWILARSDAVTRPTGVDGVKHQAKLIAAALRNGDTVRQLRSARPDTALGLLLEERPEIFGAFLWPFQNAAWDAPMRWRRIIAHCAIIDLLGSPFDFHVDQKLQVLDLSDKVEGLRLVLDRPRWFLREGLLVLNLFVGDFRALSLAFNFYTDEKGSRCAYIGAMQGRNRDDILATYRDMTKSLFGVRPRDFLIEAFRVLCKKADVTHIYAVADSCRHHRHAYFNKTDFPTNYDEIWRDRGGIEIDAQTYELPLNSVRKPIESVKPNKRSMYRKRYDFLDQLAGDIQSGLARGELVEFKDL